jgi:hypothetical protein
VTLDQRADKIRGLLRDRGALVAELQKTIAAEAQGDASEDEDDDDVADPDTFTLADWLIDLSKGLLMFRTEKTTTDAVVKEMRRMEKLERTSVDVVSIRKLAAFLHEVACKLDEPPSGPSGGGEPEPQANKPAEQATETAQQKETEAALEPAALEPASETVSQTAPQPTPFVPTKPAPQPAPPARPPGQGPRLSARTKVASHYLPTNKDPWPKNWRGLGTVELEDAIEAKQRFGVNHRLEDRHHKELAKMRGRLEVLRKADRAERRPSQVNAEMRP